MFESSALHPTPKNRPVRLALSRVLGALLLGLFALPAGCGHPDLSQEPSAVAGCEAPEPGDLEPQPIMLPGRRCAACHEKGHQAGHRVWTAAGTVYDSPSSPCNTGVVAGAKVEIADETRKVLVTLTTNSRGNFYTSEPLRFTGIIVRVSKDGKVREMQSPMATTDCASCHFPTGAAGGRVYLN